LNLEANSDYAIARDSAPSQDAAMLTRLRIVVSCLCFVLCVLFTALWMRSYRCADFGEAMSYWQFGKSKAKVPADRYILSSSWGAILFRHFPGPVRGELSWQFFYRNPYPRAPRQKSVFGFDWQRHPMPPAGQSLPNATPLFSAAFTIPHWFPALIAGLLAIAFKPSPRWGFSVPLRVVLITYVAIVVCAALTIGMPSL
jgi:hypothetical protein